MTTTQNPARQAGTFTCAHCGKRARTTAERNCPGQTSPDGRHHPAATQNGAAQ